MPAPSEQASGQGLGQDAPPTLELETTGTELPKQIAPGDLEPREQRDCPDLDSLLFQIAQAPDPLDVAAQLQLNLKVEEDKVQVLLILNQEDTGFLRDFEVEVGTQSGMQIQAFVPIDRLCDLANTDEVLAIRLPAPVVPQ